MFKHEHGCKQLTSDDSHCSVLSTRRSTSITGMKSSWMDDWMRQESVVMEATSTFGHSTLLPLHYYTKSWHPILYVMPSCRNHHVVLVSSPCEAFHCLPCCSALKLRRTTVSLLFFTSLWKVSLVQCQLIILPPSMPVIVMVQHSHLSSSSSRHHSLPWSALHTTLQYLTSPPSYKTTGILPFLSGLGRRVTFDLMNIRCRATFWCLVMKYPILR